MPQARLLQSVVIRYRNRQGGECPAHIKLTACRYRYDENIIMK